MKKVPHGCVEIWDFSFRVQFIRIYMKKLLDSDWLRKECKNV